MTIVKTILKCVMGWKDFINGALHYCLTSELRQPLEVNIVALHKYLRAIPDPSPLTFGQCQDINHKTRTIASRLENDFSGEKMQQPSKEKWLYYEAQSVYQQAILKIQQSLPYIGEAEKAQRNRTIANIKDRAGDLAILMDTNMSYAEKFEELIQRHMKGLNH